jgi:hypothetical protein
MADVTRYQANETGEANLSADEAALREALAVRSNDRVVGGVTRVNAETGEIIQSGSIVRASSEDFVPTTGSALDTARDPRTDLPVVQANIAPDTLVTINGQTAPVHIFEMAGLMRHDLATGAWTVKGEKVAPASFGAGEAPADESAPTDQNEADAAEGAVAVPEGHEAHLGEAAEGIVTNLIKGDAAVAGDVLNNVADAAVSGEAPQLDAASIAKALGYDGPQGALAAEGAMANLMSAYMASASKVAEGAGVAPEVADDFHSWARETNPVALREAVVAFGDGNLAPYRTLATRFAESPASASNADLLGAELGNGIKQAFEHGGHVWFELANGEVVHARTALKSGKLRAGNKGSR